MPLKGFPDTGNFSSAYLNRKYSLNCTSGSRRCMFEDNSLAVNSCFGKRMSPENNHLDTVCVSEGSYRKENVTVIAEQERVEEAVGVLKPPKLGKPPRHSASSIQLASTAELKLDIGVVSVKSTPNEAASVFLPVFRSGSCSEIGTKPFMEDEHICIDNLLEHLDAAAAAEFPSPGAFYGVFDGHGGTDAALYIRENILRFIVEDTHFPISARKAIESAFLKADCAFADTASLDSSCGTTALTVLLFGRKMLIANAGDCRAVLGKRGKAVELSKDHKPDSLTERHRIETLGGIVYDGYLNGQLSVARALGDWHMKGPNCPLIADPELHETVLSEEDEFLILGCDGLWDVMSSQCAVTIARRELMLHNDPERCSKELVREALKRDTRDNLTVVVICFSSDPPPRLEVLPRFSKFKRSISAEGLNLLQEVLDSAV